ncbi:MAG: hypothetical protein ACREJO_14000 [Phycisphaerales bacterium]
MPTRVFHLLVLLALTLTSLACVSGCDKHAADREAIVDLFERHQQNVRARDGKAAAADLTDASHDMTSELLKKALTLSEKATHALPGSDRLDILLIRHLTGGDKDEIKKIAAMNGRQYYEYVIEQGWTFEPTNFSLEGFKFSRTGAEAKLASDERKVDWVVYFLLENDKWMIDDTQRQRYNRVVAKYAAKNKMSEDEFMLALLYFISGREPSRNIWSPLKPNSSGGNPLLDN